MFERLLQEETIPLRAGDLYLFFTDGISEAMNAHDECFGENRLGQFAESHSHLPSDELRERVLREISAFVGEAPQDDDMTMILLKVDAVADAVARFLTLSHAGVSRDLCHAVEYRSGHRPQPARGAWHHGGHFVGDLARGVSAVSRY